MRIIKKWADDEKALAKQMARLGHSHRVIGERLGRTKKSVGDMFASERKEKGGPCSQCGKQLCPKNASGLCRSCFATKNCHDPVVRAKIGAASITYLRNNPQAAKERAQRAGATKRANPELRAKLADLMRQHVQPKSYTPDALARRDPVERGKSISRARVPWCPEEHREEYRWLREAKLLPAAEARRIIEDKIRAENQRAKADIAKLSPFERQERALEKGAAIVANDVKPSLANPGIYEERRSA